MDKNRQEAIALLARETSPAKRRTLVEELTQVFREPPSGGQRELHQVGEALAKLLPTLPVPERVRIAERVASAKYAPTYLVHQLAIDAPEVAAPILAESSVLTDAELAECVGQGGSLRLAAIARRPGLAKTLQEAIVASGDSQAIAALLANRATMLAPGLLDGVLGLAARDPAIADQLIGRSDISITSLADLFFKVGTKSQLRLLRTLEEKSGTGRALQPAQEDAEARFVDAVRAQNREQAIGALRRGIYLRPGLVEAALEDHSCLTLAVVAVGAGLSRAAFSTFVVLSHDDASWPAALAVYERIPAAGARSLLAHWQVAAAPPPPSPQKPSAEPTRRDPPGSPARKGQRGDVQGERRKR